ncbi:Glyoxalase-like domain protein [compost metagenome]
MVPSAAGTVAIAFRDFNGMVETLKAQDLLQQEPFESPVCHGAFVLDPDGNSLSLHQRKGETERDRVIDFVGMPVQDMERARAFYEGMLGLKPGDIASAAWIEYDLPDDTALALCDVRVMGLEFQPIQAGGMALRTPDLEAVFARLKQAGHAVAEDVIETSVCHMAMVKDSEGNAFLLHRHK